MYLGRILPVRAPYMEMRARKHTHLVLCRDLEHKLVTVDEVATKHRLARLLLLDICRLEFPSLLLCLPLVGLKM